ncbi:hypothetical protein SAMN04490243_2581 [Robiginitalea myxolifaciens]|uniref:Uncharacterized protein n=1 Tax=Robiginitalea myxolifaciens TaxID=400055 RepID=A0A1I6HDB3_9FLAO|nr:hypothetical protein [Robiginitalea myxolifaciens]SFR52348.1 hypothetical protein SAMN04490243_2581 [Robiginitalea myxolifaciens]
MRKIYLFTCLLIIAIVLFFLITGSSVLMIALDEAGSLPLGTLLTWLGLIAVPLAIYWGNQSFRKPEKPAEIWFSRLLKFAIVLAILWVPLAYLLAGNLSFSFRGQEEFRGSDRASIWFWRLSYTTVILPVLILLSHWIYTIFRKK